MSVGLTRLCVYEIGLHFEITLKGKGVSALRKHNIRII